MAHKPEVQTFFSMYRSVKSRRGGGEEEGVVTIPNFTPYDLLYDSNVNFPRVIFPSSLTLSLFIPSSISRVFIGDEI